MRLGPDGSVVDLFLAFVEVVGETKEGIEEGEAEDDEADQDVVVCPLGRGGQ